MNKIILVIDRLPLKGYVVLIATDPVTGQEIARRENRNLIVTVGKQLIGDMLIDVAGYDTGITYCAIGTGSAAPAVGNTTLATEAGTRQTITTKSRSGNVISLRTFFAAANCSINIAESGLFGHSTATGTANTGVLFSRSLVAYNNSGGGADITILWTITIG